MPFRSVSITAIMLFFFGTLVWTFAHGPAKRSFVIPDKTVAVQSALEVNEHLQSSGVHGRIAIIFARRLNQQFSGGSFPERDYLDTALRHGIVRTAYYIVPDSVWSEVAAENLMRTLIVPPKTTETGFIVLHVGGRIHVMPLSKYVPEQEKALVIIEPRAWSQKELSRIESFLESGQLASDLTVIIGEMKQLQQKN